MFDCVVAADLAWGIGKNNALPWPKLKRDMAHFKKITCDAPDGRRNAIIQGRRTWESAEVKGRPLPNRININISRSAIQLPDGRYAFSPDAPLPDGVLAAPSLDAALALAAAAADVATIFVIGGAQIFRDAFDHPELRSIYLTRVLANFDCDAFLPDLDAKGFAPVPWDGAFEAEDNGVTYRVERIARR